MAGDLRHAGRRGRRSGAGGPSGAGDTATHTIELFGEPACRKSIGNRFGARLGERWQYHGGDHVITVTLASRKVAAIDDQRS